MTAAIAGIMSRVWAAIMIQSGKIQLRFTVDVQSNATAKVTLSAESWGQLHKDSPNLGLVITSDFSYPFTQTSG